MSNPSFISTSNVWEDFYKKTSKNVVKKYSGFKMSYICKGFDVVLN